MALNNFEADIVNKELLLLQQLDVEKRFKKIVSDKYGLGLFAKEFYFLRCNFYKLNFIVGAKCPPHEKYWSGLTENLVEELGGEFKITHNQLYRDFLWEAAELKEEDLVTPPHYTITFNGSWEGYCIERDFEEGLLAIGLYEALDVPDYELMERALRATTNLSEKGLRFFTVHAKAQHYSMFENIIDEIQDREGKTDLVAQATNFVIKTQRFMWTNLLQNLEQRLASDRH